MTEKDFIFKDSGNNFPEKGSFTWKTPSNIALVKYWGKRDPQIPENASISFTLNACFTLTTLEYQRKKNQDKKAHFQIYFEGKKAPGFKPKIATFLARIKRYVPFITDYNFVINSRNSFPHSSGIASSASGMAALALCIMSLEKVLDPGISPSYFNTKASFLARLGSGSACRSVSGNLIIWGKHENISNSSDLYGIPFPEKIHENFKNFHDTILLVDAGEKPVSSSVGHDLMHGHPFAENRFLQATEHLGEMRSVIKNGDLKKFITLVESEALTLHAMMMTSMPYFILMKPNTLKIIHKIWKFREKTRANVCFTLDAGANVHVLYPEKEKGVIHAFIVDELVPFCQNNHYICDRVGTGSKQM